MVEPFLRLVRKLIPRSLFRALQPSYHFTLALLGALIYRFPSRQVKVVAVTGTKGKSTTAEIISAILEEAGYETALLGTVRFKIGKKSERNLFRMTVPGRFFVQRFLRRAVQAGCDWVVLEMTSEASKQFRHRFIDFDTLIFTNLAPEHIESHGSFGAYREAKLEIARGVSRSRKRPRIIIANTDDPEGGKFLSVPCDISLPYSLEDAESIALSDIGSQFYFRGVSIESKLAGIFNISNCLAGAVFAETIGIGANVVKTAIETFTGVAGRVQKISTGQPFEAIVDYAHTPDSLTALYNAFPDKKKICVLGNTGGGRDTWKRPVMGEIAEKYCEEVILTNEDPYDEDPKKIVSEMAGGMKKKKPIIIMDRREAIRTALQHAETLAVNTDSRVVVLITGKGTDSCICGPNGTKEPWDDAEVTLEECLLLEKEASGK